jgi:hypothetical protein
MKQAVQSSAEVDSGKRFFGRLSAPVATRDFAVRFWDGSLLEPDAAHSPRFTLVLNQALVVKSDACASGLSLTRTDIYR